MITDTVVGVYDVADALDRLPDGTVVARVVELRGFGSRHAGEAVALGPDGTVVAGRVLAGLVDDTLGAHLAEGAGVGTVDVDITDPDAADAGLACGGHARLLLQPLSSIDRRGWEALAARRPVVIASDLDTGSTRVVTDDGVVAGSVTDDDAVDATAARLLRGGRPALEVDEAMMIESFLPPTTVRIVGHAVVGEALAAQAALLGWSPETVDGPADAVTAAQAQSSHDALVVLSHDEAVDTPALAAALRHGRGYVGALGSRGTQAARRERLAAQGFGPEQLARIHGPVGLDLGARTPAETAVAIVAEIIAHRSGRSAASLQSTAGPING